MPAERLIWRVSEGTIVGQLKLLEFRSCPPAPSLPAPLKYFRSYTEVLGSALRTPGWMTALSAQSDHRVTAVFLDRSLGRTAVQPASAALDGALKAIWS